MDNGSPDSEEQGKHFHFRARRAVGKVLEGIFTIVTEGADLCLVEAIE